jgi:hypothetical protein
LTLLCALQIDAYIEQQENKRFGRLRACWAVLCCCCINMC